jgi:hypothetical protein
LKTIQSLVLVMVVISLPILCLAGENMTPQLDYFWANGVIYGLLSPLDVKTSTDLRNNLYVFRNLKGQRPVAESGPGDLNFQKGRYEIIFMDFTSKGISALDPDSDGNCEFEITTYKMVKSYEDMGYIKLAGRGALIDYRVVSPEFYTSQKPTSDSLKASTK